VICVFKRQGGEANPQFWAPGSGLQSRQGLKNREFTTVKFTKTAKISVNIYLIMLQLTEKQ
jgi:hypothetical protein